MRCTRSREGRDSLQSQACPGLGGASARLPVERMPLSTSAGRPGWRWVLPRRAHSRSSSKFEIRSSCSWKWNRAAWCIGRVIGRCVFFARWRRHSAALLQSFHNRLQELLQVSACGCQVLGYDPQEPQGHRANQGDDQPPTPAAVSNAQASQHSA
eukprot:scaffold2200_cov413-Prasinococcus_capsulatus_cf.AAC.29